MAREAGEPSTKRAKVDETEEEEDPLVRRKEEVVRLLKEARSREDARAERVARRELVTLCADFEAKNEEHFRRLPPELWQKILDENLDQSDLLALAMTCRFFREKQKDLGWKLATELTDNRLLDLRESGKVTSHTLGWFQWVCDTFEILPGHKWGATGEAVYEGNLVNYALFLGSVEILRWLMEEKGCELNKDTGKWAGVSGSVEVFEYLEGRGYEFDKWACARAAKAGRLEALQDLRGLDPPCPWDEHTCAWAAEGGHLDVLKWARSQNSPCPWSEWTCARAARGGHLDVLKWLRDQDPPCPWDEGTCSGAAEEGHLEILKWLRSEDPPCPWDERTCASAARGGNLDVLKFLRAQDPPCPWIEDTCAYAAKGGHLELLKFSRAQDPPCRWSELTCAWAALGGHLDVLKWARSQDPPCPWDRHTCSAAAYGGHLDVLKFLRAQDPPCPWIRSDCRVEALLSVHLHIVKWIDQQEDEI